MAKGGRPGGGGGGLLGKQGDVGKVGRVRDMVSERGVMPGEVDDVLSVGKRMTSFYGNDTAVNQFQIAQMGGGAMAYYDSSGNIAMNEKYMNAQGMNSAYDVAVKSGFHPGRGEKSGIQAVTSHEYGHALTDIAGKKLGLNDIERAARAIVERARVKTNHKTNLSFASKVSGYAKYNFAECVAESVSDWYCNGSRASKESRAVMSVLNNILKK